MQNHFRRGLRALIGRIAVVVGMPTDPMRNEAERGATNITCGWCEDELDSVGEYLDHAEMHLGYDDK